MFLDLDMTGKGGLLELTLEEAFDFQAKLNDLLRSHATNTASGLVKSRNNRNGQDHVAGTKLDTAYVQIDDGVPRHLNITLMVTRPYKKA